MLIWVTDNHEGEHGIGLGKMKSLLQELGEDTVDVMRQVKRSLDPHWLMNPGKIFSTRRGQAPSGFTQATTTTSLQMPGCERR